MTTTAAEIQRVVTEHINPLAKVLAESLGDKLGRLMDEIVSVENGTASEHESEQWERFLKPALLAGVFRHLYDEALALSGKHKMAYYDELYRLQYPETS